LNSQKPEETIQTTLVLKQLGKYGDCACGGDVVYYSDFGVRCEKCTKLYGTWVENIKKAKQEEKQRKEDIARKVEIKKFDDEMMI
jgi:predicted secreted acid phosphatase